MSCCLSLYTIDEFLGSHNRSFPRSTHWRWCFGPLRWPHTIERKHDTCEELRQHDPLFEDTFHVDTSVASLGVVIHLLSEVVHGTLLNGNLCEELIFQRHLRLRRLLICRLIVCEHLPLGVCLLLLLLLLLVFFNHLPFPPSVSLDAVSVVLTLWGQSWARRMIRRRELPLPAGRNPCF